MPRLRPVALSKASADDLMPLAIRMPQAVLVLSVQKNDLYPTHRSAPHKTRLSPSERSHRLGRKQKPSVTSQDLVCLHLTDTNPREQYLVVECASSHSCSETKLDDFKAKTSPRVSGLIHEAVTFTFRGHPSKSRAKAAPTWNIKETLGFVSSNIFKA